MYDPGTKEDSAVQSTEFIVSSIAGAEIITDKSILYGYCCDNSSHDLTNWHGKASEDPVVQRTGASMLRSPPLKSKCTYFVWLLYRTQGTMHLYVYTTIYLT